MPIWLSWSRSSDDGHCTLEHLSPQSATDTEHSGLAALAGRTGMRSVASRAREAEMALGPTACHGTREDAHPQQIPVVAAGGLLARGAARRGRDIPRRVPRALSCKVKT